MQLWRIHVLQETQSLGIHDVLNTQGLAMHYRSVSNTINHLQVFWCERVLYSKAKGLIASFSWSSTQRNVVTIIVACENRRKYFRLSTKPEFLVTTVVVTTLSHLSMYLTKFCGETITLRQEVKSVSEMFGHHVRSYVKLAGNIQNLVGHWLTDCYFQHQSHVSPCA